MPNHELCPPCKSHGHCLFEKYAKKVAENVPPLESQTPIKPGEKATQEAFDARQMISIFRADAKRYGCPKVNSVDPDYPGKENLKK